VDHYGKVPGDCLIPIFPPKRFIRELTDRRVLVCRRIVR